MDNFLVKLYHISNIQYTFAKFYTISFMKPDNIEINKEAQDTPEQTTTAYSENDNTRILQLFYQTIENGINNMPREQQSVLYRPCAVGCANAYIMKEQLRQFRECNNNLDLQYTKYGRTGYFFADIIEKGHIYEIGYPKCFCPMVLSGFAKLTVHCECSRQSIIYVLHELMPEKKIQVEPIRTILSGGNECRFKVTVE